MQEMHTKIKEQQKKKITFDATRQECLNLNLQFSYVNNTFAATIQ
jgi:hypothetical protein